MNIAHNSRGFTIVEFMVAGTLGLILLAGVFLVFLSSTQTNRNSRAMAELQNDGRFALNFLKDHVQAAGWPGTDRFTALIQHPIMFNGSVVGYDGNTNGITGGGANSSAEDFSAASVVGGFTVEPSDRLSIQYASANDCNGDPGVGDFVVDTYDLAIVDNSPTLRCNGQPLVNNVESFQVLYEISSLPQLPVASDYPENRRWVDASQVADPSRIRAVRVALLLASDENTMDQPVVRQFTLLNEVAINRNDRKLRQLFQGTIMIGNFYP